MTRIIVLLIIASFGTMNAQDECNIFFGTDISSFNDVEFIESARLSPTIGVHFLWQAKNKLHAVANLRYTHIGIDTRLNPVRIDMLHWQIGAAIKNKYINYGFVISYNDILGTYTSDKERAANGGTSLIAMTEYRINNRYKFHLSYTHGMNHIFNNSSLRSITFGISYNLTPHANRSIDYKNIKNI